jgi:hypothetical protein
LNDGNRPLKRLRVHIFKSPATRTGRRSLRCPRKTIEMASIDLHDSPFYGRTSRPAAPLTREQLECRACGSQLAGRLEGTRTWGGRLVRVYVCGCKTRRHVEVAAR